MRVELSKLHAEIGNTMIYVTHDQVEAMTMADKIVVLRGGKIEQVGTPLDLYNKPASRFVAGFIGSPRMNFVSGRVASVSGDEVSIAIEGAATIALRTALALAPGEEVSVGVRPEHLTRRGEGAWPIHVDVVEQLGGVSYIHGRLPSGEQMVVTEAGQSSMKPGSLLRAAAASENIHLFKNDGGEAHGAVH
jgi:ABC-type sugar transport system ATPase subunit